MLTLRFLAIDTVRENVAFLNRQCTKYRVEDFLGLARVEIRSNGRSLLATLNVVDDAGILKPDEIGLSTSAFRQLGVAEGANGKPYLKTEKKVLTAHGDIYAAQCKMDAE